LFSTRDPAADFTPHDGGDKPGSPSRVPTKSSLWNGKVFFPLSRQTHQPSCTHLQSGEDCPVDTHHAFRIEFANNMKYMAVNLRSDPTSPSTSLPIMISSFPIVMLCCVSSHGARVKSCSGSIAISWTKPEQQLCSARVAIRIWDWLQTHRESGKSAQRKSLKKNIDGLPLIRLFSLSVI